MEKKAILLLVFALLLLAHPIYATESASLDFLAPGNWVQENSTNGTSIELGVLRLATTVSGTGTDLTGGKTYAASTQQQNAYKAFDDNQGVPGWTAGAYVYTNHWVQVDLAGNHRVTKIGLNGNMFDGRFTGIKDFVLQASNDNSTWTNVTNGTHGDNGNMENFTFENPSSYRFYRIFIKNMYNRCSCGEGITVTEAALFETLVLYADSQPFYVTTSSGTQIATSGWDRIESVTTNESTPSGTSIKYLVSFDGRNTWKYWSGSSWQTSSLDNLQANGMSKSTLEAMTQTQWSAASGFTAGTLDFAMDLSTSDENVTPTLTQIYVNYHEHISLSYVSPDNNSVLDSGTGSVVFAFNTNQAGNCRYSTSAGIDFGSMTPVTNTGGTAHNFSISGLDDGTEYNYYVRCNDTAVGIMSNDHFSFHVAFSSYDLTFDAESDWEQENGTVGTYFEDGAWSLYGSAASYGTDVSGGKVYSASSGSSTAYKAFDDNSGAVGWAAGSYLYTNHWVQIDLGTPARISRVGLNGNIFDGRFTGIKNFVVQGSDDNATWTNISTGLHGDNTVMEYLNFDNRYKYRYYRVHVKDMYNRCSCGEGIVITEAEMMSPSSYSYPVSSSYHVSSKATSQVNTSAWSYVQGVYVNESSPSGTDTRYLVSFDQKSTWKHWNGSSWQTCSIDDISDNGMSGAELGSITQSQWATAGGFGAGSLDIAIDLGTGNASITPIIRGLRIAYSTAPMGPVVDSFTGSSYTTNFTALSNFSSVLGLTLANNAGRIRFPGAHAVNAEGQDYDSHVKIGRRFVSVDSVSLHSSFNSTTNLTLEDVDCDGYVIYYGSGTYATADEIRALNQVCPLSICSGASCIGGVLTFTAQHFTGYAVGDNSNLLVYDEIEAGGTKSEDVPVIFYANYTNITSGAHIASAVCSISFDDGSGPFGMTDNGNNYDYNKTSGFSGAGTHNWNVTCSKVGFSTLNATDTIYITASGGDVPEFSLAGFVLAMVGVLLCSVVCRRRFWKAE